jgi:hypothetical protein
MNAGGIKINYIEVLYESRDAALWIGTRDNGLIMMRNGKFAVYPTANVSGGEDVNVRTDDSAVPLLFREQSITAGRLP